MQEENNKKENLKVGTEKSVRKIFPKKNKRGEIIEGLVVDGKIWWDSNPNKQKTHKRREYKNKTLLTLKEAEHFLEVSGAGDWMRCFVHGLKGFPKLKYEWDRKNKLTTKFQRSDLVEYRKMLQQREFYTKRNPPKK